MIEPLVSKLEALESVLGTGEESHHSVLYTTS